MRNELNMLKRFVTLFQMFYLQCMTISSVFLTHVGLYYTLLVTNTMHAR